MLSNQSLLQAKQGAFFAFLAVGLGAFGAHALKASLDEYALGIYQTAVTYQMYHALALLALASLSAWCEPNSSAQRWLGLCHKAFVFGIVFFCGSLYLLSFSGLKFLGAITPIGGGAFLIAWVSLVIALTQMSRDLKDSNKEGQSE